MKEKRINKKAITIKELQPENFYISVKDMDTLIEYEACVRFNLGFLPKL